MLLRWIMLLCWSGLAAGAAPTPLDWIAVARDKPGFALVPSGKQFVPWGFNYDPDESQRLIEDYWESEWAKVEADFAEMKALCADSPAIFCYDLMNEPVVPGGPRSPRDWLGFYWGRTIEEYRALPNASIGDALTLGWLELFQTLAHSTDHRKTLGSP